MSEEKKNFLDTIAGGADSVGTLIFESVGQGAYQVCRIPGVGQAMRYAGTRVGQGWDKAEDAQQKRIAVRLAHQVAASKKRPSAESLREMCLEAGVSPDNLAKVEKACQMAVTGMDAAIAHVKGEEVPLPGKADEDEFKYVDGSLVPVPAAG